MFRFLMMALSLFFLSHAVAKDITYQIDGKKYQGFMLKKSSKAPLVLIVHDWDGLTEYEIKRAEMLEKLGHSVFAVDLFGKDVRPKETKEKRQLTGELYKDREKMRKLLNAALETAKKNGLNTKNALAIGYCFGGAVVLELARSGADLKAFVSFHGGLETPKGQNYSKTKGEVLVLHGTADESVSMTDFANLATELEKAGVKHEMTSYSGAPHAFTVFGSDRYRKEADEKSWTRFRGFLKETTGK